jgi:hypothetical protein
MAAVTHYMLAPPNGATIVANGRTYTGVAGTVLTGVPDFDRPVLEANGFTLCADGGAGTTAARPAATRGVRYQDTTLGKIVVGDGKTWRDSNTGASA